MADVRTVHAVYGWNGEDAAWEVELREEPRVHTWGRSYAQAREHVAEAAALWWNVEPDEVEVVDEHVVVSEEAQAAYGGALVARAALDVAEGQWAAQLREAALALTRQGITYRDAGDLLGVSHQRIGQVVHGTKGTGKSALAVAGASKVPEQVVRAFREATEAALASIRDATAQVGTSLARPRRQPAPSAGSGRFTSKASPARRTAKKASGTARKTTARKGATAKKTGARRKAGGTANKTRRTSSKGSARAR